MTAGAAQAVELDRLDDELRSPARPAPELLCKVIERVGTRLSLLRQAGKVVRIDRLLEAGAWSDAVFALIELELPAWRVRRLVHEHGEWLCSLSRQPNLPLAFDDPVEASHEVLALAVLRAFVEVRRRSSAAQEGIPTVPQVRPTPDQIICCDNFA
jgi:hypothetical protein